MSLVHVFSYTEWFHVPDGHGCVDWDCDFYSLVIDGDMKITLHRNNCQNDQDRLEKEFPHRFKHECSLSDHNGHLDCSTETDALKENWPELYACLDRWMSFKDRRL